MKSYYKQSGSPFKIYHQKIQNQFKVKTMVDDVPSKITSTQLVDQMVKINRDNIVKTVEIYGWRSKTYLPILRVLNFTVTPENKPDHQIQQFMFDVSDMNSQNGQQEYNNNVLRLGGFVGRHQRIEFYDVRVKIQGFRCRLSEVYQLPLAQSVYLIKEILIGFEVLVDIFGFFRPKDTMVVLNNNSQWKVWMCDIFLSNQTGQEKPLLGEFLSQVIEMVQKHSLVTSMSKKLFCILRELVLQNSVNFIIILDKINEFVSLNKIFIVNRVVLPMNRSSKPQTTQKLNLQVPVMRTMSSSNSKQLPSRMINPQGDEIKIDQFRSYQFIKASNVNNVGNSTQEKSRLNMTLTPQSNCQNLYASNGNILHLSRQIKQNSIRTVGKPKEIHFSPFSSLQFEQKQDYNYNTHQQRKVFQLSPNSEFFSLPSIQAETLQFSPLSKQTIKEIRFPQSAKYIPYEGRQQKKSNEPEGLSPFKLFNQNSHFLPIKKSHFSIFAESPKKQKARKSSDNLIRIQSPEALIKVQKKVGGSSIYNGNQQFNKQNRLKRHLSQNEESDAFQIKASEKSRFLSPDIKCGSPNNSASTKELQNSAQIKGIDSIPNYIKMKQKGFGMPYNKKSAIDNQKNGNTQGIQSEVKKELAVSYNFQESQHGRDKSLSLQKNVELKGLSNNKWTNNISGLFNENSTIKLLKGSIRMKTKQEQVFEKSYLKDVKLDMLQKFGRNVNHLVEEDDSKLQNSYSQENFKQMQLIEEEVDQLKSHLETDRILDEDLPKIDDPYLQNKEESGFNFQPQMYVINPSKR